MVLLTRLDRSKILVNIEAVKFVESTPDTLIHFINGDTMLVRESLDEFREAVKSYHTEIVQAGNEPDKG